MKALTTILLLISLTCFGQEKNPIKLGLGIVAIEDTYDTKKIVIIYKDKDLKSKLEDFKLFGDSKSVAVSARL